MNVQPERPEETWPTARLFRSAIEFVEHNHQNTPFYLYVDGFTPHETWEGHQFTTTTSTVAERSREPICLNLALRFRVKDEETRSTTAKRVKANYAGLVTLVDTWFGRLVDTIDRLGLRENTLIIFLGRPRHELRRESGQSHG